MSESFPEKIERAEHQPVLPSPEHHKELAEHAEVPKHVEQNPAKAAYEARSKVQEVTAAETRPNPLEELEEAENGSDAASPRYVNHELKSITLSRELSMIRRKLPAPQRALSRVVHQPAVRIVSEAAGSTVSRPSGLLGGGLVAFAGTSTYLYLARHIGFTYNYSVVAILFAGGFVFGLLLELLVHLAMASRRAVD